MTGDYQEEPPATMDVDQNPTFIGVQNFPADADDTVPLEMSTSGESEANIVLEERNVEPKEENNLQTGGSKSDVDEVMGHVAQQLYIFRRLTFFLFAFIYIISIPICLF